MARYCVFTADWDSLRAMDDGRDKLWSVMSEGETVEAEFYEDGFWLEADSVGDVFYKLNMDPPMGWRRRSMSVGDVVVDPEGNAKVCRPVGWEDAPEMFARCAGDAKGVWAAFFCL